VTALSIVVMVMWYVRQPASHKAGSLICPGAAERRLIATFWRSMMGRWPTLHPWLSGMHLAFQQLMSKAMSGP